ncbi:hypothetical protein STAS_21253 [Striga asiatica]|uniref:Trichome birefringence-like C-terminal domain-containing protein n=1 Tax=Striga asiatica TaxID=4170 RepID=A0A5A7QHF5_STRAF|nr:hypothetical protein STAS_21253 [Striga asiatica]
MEKQRIFSLKPIRFLAFSLTISFSVVFLIFFSTWVFKPTTSRTLNLDFTNTSLNTNSSQYVDKVPIFTETHYGEFEFSSKSGDFSKIAERGSEKATVVSDAGNSSLTSFGENIFNAARMLELIRGKRLVFVGDSINRNQWESMLCLLVGAVKDPKKVYEARGRKITKERGNYCFKFEDYKCTVEFYVSHYLVHESKARIERKRTQTLRIDTIDKGSSRWRGADILVFNTAHWWSHSKTKAGINYYQEGDQVYPRLDVTEAFRRALLTWASWVDKYINPRKTRVFFRSSSPSHFSGGLWNSGGHCKEAFRPINVTFTSNYPEKNLIVEKIISQMKSPVTFLNITQLSDYRPDAHPSIYGRKSIKPSIQDCSHWCLPGVPDIWNELLYYHLQSSTKANFINL